MIQIADGVLLHAADLVVVVVAHVVVVDRDVEFDVIGTQPEVSSWQRRRGSPREPPRSNEKSVVGGHFQVQPTKRREVVMKHADVQLVAVVNLGAQLMTPSSTAPSSLDCCDTCVPSAKR